MLNWCQSWVIVREKLNTEASEFTLNPEVEEVEVKELEELEVVEVEEEVEVVTAEVENLELEIHNNVLVAFQEVVAGSLEVEREDFDKSPVDEEVEEEEGGETMEMRGGKEVSEGSHHNHLDLLLVAVEAAEIMVSHNNCVPPAEERGRVAV